MITLAVHWVDEPKLEYTRHGSNIHEMLDLLDRSAPHYKKVFLTDQDGPSPRGWDTKRAKRRDENVMGHMMRARVDYLREAVGYTVFLDADSLILKPLDKVFRGDWSMCVPWFPKYLSGVMLVRDIPFAKQFFQTAHDKIRDLPVRQQLFGADLSVTKDMILSDDGGIRKEQQDVICKTAPDNLDGLNGWSPGNAHIVNFKGVRKSLMPVVFRQYVDI